jgi:hypothetical protein
MTKSDHLPIYLDLYQLNKHLYSVIRGFPKDYKYTLGENILRLNWECIDIVIIANSLSKKEKYLKITNLSIVFDCLKTRLRMAQEIGIISHKQYIHIQMNYIKKIGEMIGGWLSWSSRFSDVYERSF